MYRNIHLLCKLISRFDCASVQYDAVRILLSNASNKGKRLMKLLRLFLCYANRKQQNAMLAQIQSRAIPAPLKSRQGAASVFLRIAHLSLCPPPQLYQRPLCQLAAGSFPRWTHADACGPAWGLASRCARLCMLCLHPNDVTSAGRAAAMASVARSQSRRQHKARLQELAAAGTTSQTSPSCSLLRSACWRAGPALKAHVSPICCDAQRRPP